MISLRETGALSFALPENRRLVPEVVTRKGRILGPVQFGFEMGTGVRTYSPSALPHLCLVFIILFANLEMTIAGAVGFAGARLLMALSSLAYSRDGLWSKQWAEHSMLLARALAGASVIVFTSLFLSLW